LRVASVVALVVLLAAPARPDGVVIPSRAVVTPVRTPDQRALVAFDGTTETLVVETTVQGEGRDFAWIVPLPAAPKVEASTTGLFPTLAMITSQDVEERSDREWAVPLALIVGVVAAFLASRRLHAAIAAFICAVAMYFAFAIASIFTLASAASEGVGVGVSARELRRETVGALDVATVDPGDGSGLRRWLSDHGFAASPAVDAVATDYAKRGWVFVAAKLRMDAESADVRRVHPLAFTFATKEAVYPMRLTMAANPTCAVELFAFGDGTASADGMSVEFASSGFDGENVHRELAKRSRGLPVTKLVGTFDATTLRDDLVLRWGPRVDVQPILYSGWAAYDQANTWAAWTALVGGLVASIAVGSWRRGPSRTLLKRRIGAYAAVAAISCATFFIVWSATPKLPADARRVWDRGRDDFASTVSRKMPDAARSSLAAAREWTARWAADRQNDLAGGPLREEDSPGNYTLREVDERLEIVMYGGRGSETSTDLVERR
jgi:hypothetical protein